MDELDEEEDELFGSMELDEEAEQKKEREWKWKERRKLLDMWKNDKGSILDEEEEREKKRKEEERNKIMEKIKEKDDERRKIKEKMDSLWMNDKDQDMDERRKLLDEWISEQQEKRRQGRGQMSEDEGSSKTGDKLKDSGKDKWFGKKVLHFNRFLV